MFRAKNTVPQAGFTLVELLVIAPIALLVITGFIAVMVTMVGDVIVSRSENAMTYDIQSALTSVERDVRLSTEFLTTTGALPSPQGKNGTTSAFTSTSGDLILGEIATDKNPVDPTRKFTYYQNSPNSCTSDRVYQNRVFYITVVYTIRNNSLWRRTYVPTAAGTLCQTPWQVNTCAPGYTTPSRCQATDSEVLKNVKSFNVSYYINPEDTVPISAASASSASSIRVAIEGESTPAGRVVSASSSARSTKLSAQEVNLAPPAAPVVTGTASTKDVTFSWPSVPTASSYIVQYNVTGNGINTGWKYATENTTETAFSIPASHGDTVSVKVQARNTTGASAEASAAATIPLWVNCELENGWVNYAAGYNNCGFTITKDGVVVLRGILKDGTRSNNVRLFQLPEGYRPPTTQIFTGLMTNNGSVRLQVEANGNVMMIDTPTGGASSYLSLDDILFVSSDAPYSWTSLAFQNGWLNYSASWQDLSSTRDVSGRVHLRGLIKQGTYTSGTPIALLPADSRPSEYYILPARSGASSSGDPNQFGIVAAGNIVARGINSNSYLSTQAMFYPSSYAGWTNFTTVAGAPSVGQIGNGWVAYGTDAGGNYTLPAYTKSNDGIVTIKGLIKNGTTTNGTVVAQLPVGYRPKARHIFTSATYGQPAARVDVTAAGQITAQGNVNATWLAINLSFVAEQ